jgi:isopenicillin N synthase-like dioxygenase
MPKEGDFLANLPTISYEKLLKHDVAESASLFEACTGWGFFYLDLRATELENYRNLVSRLQVVSKNYFNLPLEQKMKDKNEEWAKFRICG